MIIIPNKDHLLIKVDNKTSTYLKNNLHKNNTLLQNTNIIIEFNSNITFINEEFSLFLLIVDSYITDKNSLIIVYPNIKNNNYPNKYNIVGTLTEALDVLEIEEIERDLKI